MKRCHFTAFAILLMLALNTNAPAATITVTSTADSGAGSLRQAVADAAVGDTIRFNLTYPATITLASRIIISKSMNIAGPSANLLTVSGNNASRVFHVQNAGTSVTVSGLTVARGYNSGAMASGSAFTVIGAALTLESCVIRDNVTTSTIDQVFGGAIGMSSGAVLEMNRCTIQNNTATYSGTATNAYGGAIYGYSSTLNIYNSTISGNAASAGSAIYVYDCKSALANVTISGNHASDALAVVITGSDSSLAGPNSMLNCTLSANASGSTSNGGLQVEAGSLSLRNSVLAGNLRSNGTELDITFIAAVSGTTVTSEGNNFVGLGYGLSYIWTSGDTVGSSGNIPDPGLLPLADNGGYVRTHALTATSILRDPADSNGAPFVDGRGYPRYGTADKGACEYATWSAGLDATNVGLSGFQANWEPVSGAVSYLLDVATDPAFTAPVSGYANLAVGNVTTYAVSGLSSETTYYYRVRAVNGKYMSSYFDEKSVTTLVPSPTVTPTGTATPIVSATPTPSATQTVTALPSQTVTATATQTSVVSPTLTAVSAMGGQAFLAYPNPSRSHMVLAVRAALDEIHFTIYNANGERVAALTATPDSQGMARAVWDCQAAGPGIYFVRWEQAGKNAGNAKIAVVK